MERIGRYEVVRELGHGAMGRVFLARDPSLERSVALKLLATASSGARARFHDEAKALAALNHPGIVTIYEVSEHDGQDFIAMEYLAGKTLRELLAAGASREELVAICAKVALAVDAAHRAGILHRDIKPENIIITDDGAVKVVDFGVARRMRAGHRHTPRRFETPVDVRVDEIVAELATMRVLPPELAATELTPGTQTVFGTPAYIAPEVLVGDTSSEASDVYSLGVTLHECLAGRRPHDYAHLAELIARVIDGGAPPARLADPLGELVERMLAREPEARPRLAVVAAELAPRALAPLARRRRWPYAIGASALVAGGAAGWLGFRGHHAAAPPAAAVIAVEPIELDLPGQNVPPTVDVAVGNGLATVAGGIDAVKVVSPDDMFGVLKIARTSSGPINRKLTATQLATAERELGATLVVRGKIEGRDGKLTARLEVVAGPGGASQVIEREAAFAELPSVLLELGERIAHTVNPDAKLAPGDTHLARALTARGLQAIKDAAFYDGDLFLEQAVLVDAKLYDAWNTLALARAWMFAPDDRVEQAVTRARELAPDETSRQLLTGIGQYLDHDFRAALATLAPLEAKTAALDEQQKHDLYYYLGETHWHAGRQQLGIEYFRRVLDLDPRFAPAAIHPADFALARRDGATARALSYLLGSHRDDSVEFSIGHYEALADHGPPDWQIPAQIVLGRPTREPADSNPLGIGAFRLARASETGDRAAADAASASVWQFVASHGDAAMAPSDYYELSIFGEVVICGGRSDDIKKLVAHLGAHAHEHVGGYPRMLLLAAPLLRDKTLIVHDYVSDRMTKLADASEAELAGNRVKAVALLRELVADPSPFWDYPERAALIRNLRALGKPKDAAAVCADSMRPAVFRAAFMPLRKLCATFRARAR